MSDYNFPFIIQNNRNPTNTDDTTKNIIKGQIWINSTIDNYLEKYFICLDNTENNAIWIILPEYSTNLVHNFKNTNIITQNNNIKLITNDILDYICKIYLDSCLFIHYPDNLHNILQAISDYLCYINISNTCLTSLSLHDILYEISEIVSNISLVNQSVFSLSNNLHSLLLELINYICKIDLVYSHLNIQYPDNLHNILQAISDYLCHINISNTCLYEDPNITDNLHNILQAISDYLCHINISNTCLYEDPNITDNLHNILQAISDYLCHINISNTCIFDEFDITKVLLKLNLYLSKIHFNNTCLSILYFDSLHNILQAMSDYLCNISFNQTCLNINNIDNLHNILQAISDYLCNIQLDFKCFNWIGSKTVLEILNKINLYVCQIPLNDNCLQLDNINNLHTILNTVNTYLCHIDLPYKCINRDHLPTTEPPEIDITTTEPPLSGCSFEISSWDFTDLGVLSNSHGGELRTYNSNSMPDNSLWTLVNGGLRIDFEDSMNCGGFNNKAQTGTARSTINVLQNLNLFIDWDGIGENQGNDYERMELIIDGNLISRGHAFGGGQGCATAPIVSEHFYPDGYLLTSGHHIIEIFATTEDRFYHVNCYYLFTFRCESI